MTEREKLFNLATHSNNPAWRWFPNNAEMLRFVDYLLANGVTVQKWIPVSERLPEKEGNYLVATIKGNVAESYFFPECDIVPGIHRDAVFCYPGVTHWMPLPEPPKEETQ